MQSIIIDPHGNYLKMAISSGLNPVLVVVISDVVKKEVLIKYHDIISENMVFTIDDIWNSPLGDGINPALIKKYRHIESDIFFNSLRFEKNINIVKFKYLNALSWWVDFIEDNDIDLIFSARVLHGHMHDTLPFEVCRENGILGYYTAVVCPYIYSNRVVVEYDTMQLLTINDSRIDSSVVFSYPMQTKKEVDGQSANDLFTSFSGHLRKGFEFNILLRKTLNFLVKLIGFVKYEAIKSILTRHGSVDYHSGGNRFIVIKNAHKYSEKLQGLKYLKTLKLYYERNSERPIDLNMNYVYVSLHLEPEAVLASISMNNQISFVAMISKSLPLGWKVVIKEHPAQFDMDNPVRSFMLPNILLYKSENAYKQLLTYENVVLANTEISSNLLIINAKAVFSITGCAIIEGLYNNIPVACISNTPFARLFGLVTSVSCQMDISLFFDKIRVRNKDSKSRKNIDSSFEKIFIDDELGRKIIMERLHQRVCG